jgi:ribulose-5-phosphate 4-epimerase/fuculose-1-phosphate aldolase
VSPVLHPPTMLRRRALDRRLRRAGARLEAAGLVRGRSGNLSARTGDGLRITAAGARLGDLRGGDLVTVAPGRPARGRTPSSETALHAAVYRARPDVGAVVHTHGPYSTAWAGITSSLDLLLEEARYYGMGTSVPVVPWMPAGSAALATAACQTLGSGVAVLLADHGALAVGPDLVTALDVAESLEHQALVGWLLRRNQAIAADAFDGVDGLAWPTH